MEARMKNPALIVPGAGGAVQALIEAVQKSGAPPAALQLAHLRASQINSCAVCVDGGVRHAKKAGETDERLHSVAASTLVSFEGLIGGQRDGADCRAWRRPGRALARRARERADSASGVGASW